MIEFIASKRFAAGRDDKGQLRVFDKAKKGKASQEEVKAWAKRGWVEIIESKPKSKK